MSPSLSLSYRIYGLFFDVIKFCQKHTRPPVFCKMSNVQDIVFCQKRSTASRSFWRSALFDFVSVIFIMRTKEKMIWTDAERIVAPVTDLKIFWDWAVFHFPRKTMRFLLLFMGKSKRSITFVFTGRPKPTRICFNNLGPKAFFNFLHMGRLCQRHLI